MKEHAANHLLHETSPYLLQHAYNPVEWFPWGFAALQKAKQQDMPILLSIGYMACHWCHVMEQESFENEVIAALMNAHFVCIKVDREERPDLDVAYMAAAVAFNEGHGGWPMTVFLTPEQTPFFAGTYFPPYPRHGLIGFADLLQHIAILWKTERAQLLLQAQRITFYLAKQSEPLEPFAVSNRHIEKAVALWKKSFDSEYGGFGHSPKFPPTSAVTLFLRVYYNKPDPQVLQMICKTLDSMAQGGMCDQLSGGFSRYSVDKRWHVPHFEKMLYDNALLLLNYLEAFQITKNLFYRQIASEIADFVLEEMSSPLGVFYSAIDADSEGVEGRYYVWTKEQIEALLPAKEAAIFCSYYGVTVEGNWDSTNVLHMAMSLSQCCALHQVTEPQAKEYLQQSRKILLSVRKKRIPPATDDKILTAWNGLMITALSKAGQVLQEKRYLQSARIAADFILDQMLSAKDGLLRTYRSGKAHIAAYLEDYAYFSQGLIALYVATGEERYLQEALRLCVVMVTDFRRESQNAFCSTSKRHQALYAEIREGYDNVLPNSNAIAAQVCIKIGYYFDRTDLIEIAEQALLEYGKQIDHHPTVFATSLVALDLLLMPQQHLVLVGSSKDLEHNRLKAVIDQHFLPYAIIAYQTQEPDKQKTPIALLRYKHSTEQKPAVYLCRGAMCYPPITTVEELQRVLSKDSGNES